MLFWGVGGLYVLPPIHALMEKPGKTDSYNMSMFLLSSLILYHSYPSKSRIESLFGYLQSVKILIKVKKISTLLHWIIKENTLRSILMNLAFLILVSLQIAQSSDLCLFILHRAKSSMSAGKIVAKLLTGSHCTLKHTSAVLLCLLT